VRMGTRLVHRSYERSHARARIRRGVARLQVHESVFCTVREPVGQPLCRFYAAAVARLLSAFGPPVAAHVTACRGTTAGGAVCVVTVPLRDTGPSAIEEPAA
jgi:predicted hydrocarbon binding protein